MFSTIAFSVNFYLLDPEEIHLSEFASGVARLQGLFIVVKFRVSRFSQFCDHCGGKL